MSNQSKPVRVVHRPEWVPPSLRDSRVLIRGGCEKVNGVTFIRLERWSRRRRAFVLEALALPDSPILKVFNNARAYAMIAAIKRMRGRGRLQ